MKNKNKVKKFFIMLSIWALGIVVTLGAIYLNNQSKAKEYDIAVIPYLIVTVPELSKWNPEITKKLMVAEVSENISDETFRQAIDIFARMGALKSMAEPEFDKVLTEKATKSGRQTVIVYSVDAIYENGVAELSVQLVEKESGYEVFHFNVSSEALAKE